MRLSVPDCTTPKSWLMMRILEHAFSIVSLLSLLLLGPALGRALLLWWDKRRERSLPSQYIALATCTMIALTGLIMVYGVVWQANHRMVAWYSWIDAIPVNADVSAIRLGAREVRLKCLSLISSFRQSLKRFSLLGSHWRDRVQFFNHGGGKRRGEEDMSAPSCSVLILGYVGTFA